MLNLSKFTRSILNEERTKSIEGRLDYIASAIKKLEVAKKRITEAFKAEVMTLPELRKEKTDIELSEEKLISERDALMMKLNVQHDVSAKIDLFKETCHKFLSKINDPKIVTERLKKDIIKLVIDEVVIEGESVKIFATIPLPNKIHEREMDKTDIPGTFNAGATLGPVNETNMARIWNKHKQSNTPLKRKVFVGLSGGVDSSVSALLLKQAGHDVTGVFIKAWYPEFIDCNWREEMRDAMRVCAKLEIPFLMCDLEAEYKKHVVDYLVNEYKTGRTPNPDVMCNKHIKFDGFLKFAIERGADFVATGHYAQNIFQDGVFHLTHATDQNKDQSYFLWTLDQEKLSKILFSIGHLTKPEVRKLAEKNNLLTADKKDSQGLCFLGHVDIENFLSHFLQTKSGDVLNLDGEIIGKHHGAIFYTFGQRHGFEISEKITTRDKYYVVDKNVDKNTITVSDKRKDDDNQKNTYTLSNLNLINKIPEKILCQYRYRGEFKKIKFRFHEQDRAEITFENLEETLAPGQSIVIYNETECLGGGIIL